MVTLTCPRCNGTGHYSYHPMHGTVCFKCDGAGKVEYTESQYKAMQTRARKAQEKRELEEETRKANIIMHEKVIAHMFNRYGGLVEYRRRTSHVDVPTDALKRDVLCLLARDELDEMGIWHNNTHKGIWNAYIEHIYFE